MVWPVPGRYQFSLPERPDRDGWFKVGQIDVTTTALLVGLGVLSMFVYAIDKSKLLDLAFVPQFGRDGEVWRLVTWPLVNPPTEIWVVLTLVFFWLFGHRTEDHIGRKRFTLLVAAMAIIPTAIVTLITFDINHFTFGLGILGTGLLVIFALDNPGAMFFFGIPAWIIALVFVGIDVLRMLGDEVYDTLLVELLVIGVAIVGARQCGMIENLAFIPQVGKGKAKSRAGAQRSKPRGGKRAKGGQQVVQGPWQSSGPSPADQIELDILLDKIGATGMDSLSRGEKQRLNELSKRLRGR